MVLQTSSLFFQEIKNPHYSEETRQAKRLDRLSASAWSFISDSYYKRIIDFIKEAERNPDLLNTTKTLPADYSAMSVMAEMLTKSFLMGLDRSTRKMEFAEPTAEEIETLPYAEAVEYLKKRDVLNKVDYDKLSAQLKFRAFTASRISDGALLKRINGELIKNIEDGNGLKDFLGMTKTDVLSKVGLGNAGGWYWETVYRTNVQTAYNAGRMMGYEEDKPLALELVVIDDARTTDYCRQYAGKGFILPYDDPFWKTHIPPFHFNCRTTVRAIYDEREIPQQWSSKADIEKPAKGFGNNPVVDDSWWKELSSQVRQAKMYGVQGEIEAAKHILLSENNNIDPNLFSKKIISEEELKEVELIKQKFLQNKFFLESTEKYLSLEGVDAKSAKITYEAYEKVFNKYPKIKGVFPSVKTKLMGENVFARTEIMYSRSQIYLNKLFFKDYDVLENTYAKTVIAKFHPEGTTAIANVYHEIAHCIDSLLTSRMTSKQKSLYKTFSEFAQNKVFSMTKLNLGDILKNVSGYASRTPEEWFSECFAEFMNSNDPREMAKALELFLRNYL